MAGAPSQLDLFDYKPDLHKQFKRAAAAERQQGPARHGDDQGQGRSWSRRRCSSSHRQGKNGICMSELLPHLSTVVDDLCIIKSMHTDAINHDPGKTLFCTGSEIPGKASMGAWLSYGLGG